MACSVVASHRMKQWNISISCHSKYLKSAIYKDIIHDIYKISGYIQTTKHTRSPTESSLVPEPQLPTDNFKFSSVSCCMGQSTYSNETARAYVGVLASEQTKKYAGYKFMVPTCGK